MTTSASSWWKKDIRIRLPQLPDQWRRWISRLFTTLLVLLAIWFTGWRVHLNWQIKKQLEVIRASGLPTSGQELNIWYQQVPDADNAALVLTQAFALLRTFPDRRSNEISGAHLLDRSTKWSADTRKMVGEYVAMNVEALGKAREGIQRARCRYAADFSYGPDTELPHLGELKRLARVALLRSTLTAEEGHDNAWAEDLRLTLRLAATLGEEPTLISHLVRNSIPRIAIKTTERNLNFSGFDGNACEKLEASFADVATTNLLATALIGERAMLAPVFRMSWGEIQNLSKTDENGLVTPQRQPFSGKPATILWLIGLFERELNFFLRIMETNISLAALSPPASLAFTNVSEHFQQVARQQSYILSGLLLPSYSRVMMRDAITLAQIRLVKTALAVERFRLAHGRLPENLNSLNPQFLNVIPSDPFDGAPLRYRRLDKGFVIYSIDSDGHDDSGHEKPANLKSTDKTSYDITFTVER